MRVKNKAWLELTVDQTDDKGVDPRKLATFLRDISAAFVAIVHRRLSATDAHERKVLEDTLADIRVLRVKPGSMKVEIIPPPSYQTVAPRKLIGEVLTPDDVATEFYEQWREIKKQKEPIGDDEPMIRKRVRAVIRDAGAIGKRAKITYRPLSPRPEYGNRRTLSISVSIAKPTPLQVVGRTTRPRTRRLSGCVYMIDVEPGKERLRIKLPTGKDLTVGASESVSIKMDTAIRQVVEIEVEEEGRTRVARDLAILPSSRTTSGKPAKSIKELEQEQGLTGVVPDYQALASAIWETKSEVTRFEKHLHGIRNAEAST